MLAEVILTPAESKRIIGKAVASMEIVKKAFKSGLIVIIKGTTNSYVAEEILGRLIEKERYGRGVVVPGRLSGIPEEDSIPDVIIENGRIRENTTISEALDMLKPGDVLIKGANALDLTGCTGVFMVRTPTTTGGTIGRSFGIVMARGISLIIPVSLEKLIPTSINKVVNQVRDKKVDLAMGWAVGVMPTTGTVVTEIEAFRILTEVEAINIGAGGVGGAEGARIFLLKGEEERVRKAFNLVKSIQGEAPFKPISYQETLHRI